MKKIALLVMALLALPSYTFAGGTCVLQEVGGNYVYQGQILLKCTAASNDASMSHTFSAGEQFMNLMDGRYILGALTYDGAGTDATANTDLAITDSDGKVLVNPATNGLDVVDNGDDHSFYFLGHDGSAGFPRASSGKPWTITWTNNAVNSGVDYLLIDVTGERNAR